MSDSAGPLGHDDVPGASGYVIVGAGTAGSVLAARLSEDEDVTVTLLEAGTDEGLDVAADPGAWRRLPGTSVDWGFATAPQASAHGRVLPYPRGKAVGGSSVINAMMHVRPLPEDFRDWPSSGSVSWTYGDLLPFLQTAEGPSGEQDTARRGTAGPVGVRESDPDALSDAALDALSTVRHAWVGRFPLAIADGRRVTAADAHLTPDVRARPNLTIVRGATAARLTFDHRRRCTGVVYESGGAEHVLTAVREVIVCAGVVGTPQLLQLSGIGDSEVLDGLGLPVIAHSPDVGRNLREHPLVTMIYPAEEPLPAALDRVEAGALLFSDDERTRPDLQVFVMHSSAPGGRTALAIGVSVISPRSTGSVTVVAPSISTAPRIDPGLLSDPEDLARLAAGTRIVRDLVAHSALTRFASFEAVPGPGTDTDDALRDRLRDRVGVYWHGVGTARMGTDPLAVVDVELLVRGVSALRVVDASVMPTIVSANTNATVLAIAERAAHLIRTAVAGGGAAG